MRLTWPELALNLYQASWLGPIEKLKNGFILKPEMDSTGKNYPGHYSLGILDAPRHPFIDTQGAKGINTLTMLQG